MPGTGLQGTVPVNIGLVLHLFGMTLTTINRIVSNIDLNKWGYFSHTVRSLKAGSLGQLNDVIEAHLSSFIHPGLRSLVICCFMAAKWLLQLHLP